MDKVVISMSGGLDSTTLLYTLKESYEVHPVFFTYGSKHNDIEKRAAEDIISLLGMQLRVIDVSSIFKGTTSSLLNSDTEIPKGHYTDSIMANTIVPGRNLIFISILASIADNIKAKYIALGVHAGDNYIYPDCRPDFLHNVTSAVLASTSGKVNILTPFVNLYKKHIIQKGHLLKVPFELTRTCYTSNEIPCGVCAACVERAEGFELANLKDPAL